MNIREGLRALLLNLIVYLFLPLLGWWIGGMVLWPPPVGELLTTFLAEPARLVYLLAVCTMSIILGWLNASFPIDSKAFMPRPGLLHWRNIALETILVLGPYCDRRDLLTTGDSTFLRWAGLILFILGSALALWANELLSRAAAARQASPDTKDAPYEPILLVEGPYKHLRYPVYLGQLAFSLGAALLFRSWIGLGSYLLMVNFILMRIREEEQRAKIKHGILWSAYSRHSWKLIPFIY